MLVYQAISYYSSLHFNITFWWTAQDTFQMCLYFCMNHYYCSGKKEAKLWNLKSSPSETDHDYDGAKKTIILAPTNDNVHHLSITDYFRNRMSYNIFCSKERIMWLWLLASINIEFVCIYTTYIYLWMYICMYMIVYRIRRSGSRYRLNI